MSLQSELKKISEQIERGVTPSPVTVRKILDWLGVSRRGNHVNWRIRHALEQAGLETKPDFEWTYLYYPLRLVKAGSDEESISTLYRIDGLESANQKPVALKPDSDLTKATTVMLTNDFSQLPVITTDRNIKGIISWKSIGSRLSLNKKCSKVRECMDPAQVINADASLFDAIGIIAEHDYVLVQAQDRTVCGIVTASDLSQQFRDLAEPFLLIGECEYFLRRLIHGKFALEDLHDSKNPNDTKRTVGGVADLTLGEFIRLLEDKTRWEKIRLSIDQKEFILRLDKVREIRNDVMHFDPQGVDPDSLQALREFVRFLKELKRLEAI